MAEDTATALVDTQAAGMQVQREVMPAELVVMQVLAGDTQVRRAVTPAAHAGILAAADEHFPVGEDTPLAAAAVAASTVVAVMAAADADKF
jgi:hypothetical protein